MISKDNAFSLIEKSGSLPTLPAILLKLLTACESDDTPLSEIAAIISKDPVLSFKVLQLVNSAYYGFRYSFKGIEQAVVYLGANTIKNIAVTMSVHQVFERKRFAKVRSFNINVFWYNSLLCATLAKRIAQKIGFGNIDEAYLSGLLHDIGRLVLISTFPNEHETILAATKDRRNTPWAETQLLGVTHAETGSWLVQKWRLGSMMADAIQYHHEPLDRIKEAFPLVKIIYVATLLGEESDDTQRQQAIDQLVMELDQTDIQEIIAGAAEEVEQIAINLEIPVESPAATVDEPARSLSANPEGLGNVSSGASPDHPALSIDEADDPEGALREALAARIKSVSLLSTFLENLVRAGNVQEIIAACEQAMSILFNIDKVLFFLTDKEGVLLRGYTSPVNSLHQTSWGLTLALQQSSSLVIKTFHEMSMAYLTVARPTDNLADRQLLTVLQSDTVLIVPLVADKKPAGVVLLGLPATTPVLSDSDHKLVQVIGQQVGLCLQLERMKEQKAAELEAERMAAVSMTARKVAHEINNPLGIISNYIASMKLRLAGDEQLRNELSIVDEEIHRISSMIGQIDMFSKEPVCRLEITDVNATIEDIVQLVRAAHYSGPGMAVSFVPDRTLPRLMTSKDAIKQVLINLLKNAAEAMIDGGEVTVTTRRAAEDGVDGREGIEIVVTDTGPGLPESVKANLYTPFVTTKRNGHSGLGLSIVHKTIKDLGGTLSCTTAPTDGTSFSIFLPNTGK